MFKKIVKEQNSQAKKRLEKYTPIENIVFVCELLDLLSDKYENQNQNGIAFDLQHISYKLSKLLSEIF